MAKASLGETFESVIKSITTWIGLSSALSGFVAGWATSNILAGFCITVFVALCASNFWLWKASRPQIPRIPALDESRSHWIGRCTFHVFSVLLGIGAVGLFAILSYDRWEVRARLWAFGCERATPAIVDYVAGKGHLDVGMRKQLATCYHSRYRVADAIATEQALLNDQEALATIGEEERSALIGFLHADIGLSLLSSYDPSLKSDALQARRHLNEAALIRGGDWFVLDLLAYATAQTGAKSEAKDILSNAQSKFEAIPNSSATSNAWQHFHWQGRTLLNIGSHTEAENAFKMELALLPAGSEEAATADGYQRAAEYGRTNDLSALRRYFSDTSTAAPRARIAVELTNALIQEADTAYRRGDAQGAARIAKEAEGVLSVALQFNALHQGRASRVRAAQLALYAGRNNEAVSIWRELVKEEPANKNYLLLLVEATLSAALFDDGREAIKLYLAMEPRDPFGHYQMAVATQGLARRVGLTAQKEDLYRTAEQEMETAANLAPADPSYAGGLSDLIAERSGKLESGESRIPLF